jgi:hypothetical protein
MLPFKLQSQTLFKYKQKFSHSLSLHRVQVLSVNKGKINHMQIIIISLSLRVYVMNRSSLSLSLSRPISSYALSPNILKDKPNRIIILIPPTIKKKKNSLIWLIKGSHIVQIILHMQNLIRLHVEIRTCSSLFLCLLVHSLF